MSRIACDKHIPLVEQTGRGGEQGITKTKGVIKNIRLRHLGDGVLGVSALLGVVNGRVAWREEVQLEWTAVFSIGQRVKSKKVNAKDIDKSRQGPGETKQK